MLTFNPFNDKKFLKTIFSVGDIEQLILAYLAWQTLAMGEFPLVVYRWGGGGKGSLKRFEGFKKTSVFKYMYQYIGT